MPRIRTLTAVGVLAGATVLGGAGLAGATDHTSEPEDQESVEVRDQDQIQIDDLDTGEPDVAPEAPELPDTAAERAHTALAEAPAFAEDEAQPTETAPEPVEEQQLDTEESTTDDAEAEATEPDDHGQRVSEVARSDDPGPGPDHGPAVAAEAKKNGGSSEARGPQG